MNDAPIISMTGGYESRGQTFCRYRPASVVWAEFQQFWAQNHPGQALPGLHNLVGMTGLSRQQLWRLRANVSETSKQNSKSVDMGAQAVVR